MSRWKLLSLLLPVLMLLALCGPGRRVVSAAQPDRNFTAHLTGDQETADVDTQAQGQIILRLSKDGTVLSYKLIVSNIDKVFGAHLHLAPAGENGAVVVSLFGPVPATGRVSGVLAEGTITAGDLEGPLEGDPLSALIEAIREGDIYANVHTTDYPAGEIRGQL